jgi:3-oxoacyl-[acyl-carrier protein] reductase
VQHAIESSGGSAECLAVDVSDAPAFARAIEGVAEKNGRLDILINNAGITKDNLSLRMSDEDWDSVLDTNLKSAFVAIRAAARSMMKHRFGRIVNIGSTSGVVGNSGQANYAAAKAGLMGLTKTIARELGSKGVTCNCIAPGFIETDMTSNLPTEVKDIAATVAYVTSDEAGFLTGQTICVDGGMTMC